MKRIITLSCSLMLLHFYALSDPVKRRGPVLFEPELQTTAIYGLPAGPFSVYLTLPRAKATGTGSRITSEYYGTGMANGTYRNKDSIRYTYTGNRGGDLNSNILFDNAQTFSWDTVANVWRPVYSYANTFDAQNRLTMQVAQSWSTASSSFLNYSRVSFVYNTQGRITLQKTEYWNSGTSAWMNSLQYTNLTYDGSGHLTGYLAQTWNVSSGVWVNNTRYTATNNSGGQPLTELFESWNGSVWNKFSNYTYTYNAASYNTSITRETWDAGSSSWRNYYRYFYYYNAANKEIAMAHQVGINGGMAWGNADSSIHTSLNSAGLPLITYNYISISASWVASNRFTRTYNNNLESTVLQEDWNGSSYVSKQRGFSFYNSFGQLNSNYDQSYGGSIWAANIGNTTSRFGYQNYSTAVTSVSNELQLQLYPNPAAEQMNIELDRTSPTPFSVSVYDINGRMHMTWQEAGGSKYTKSLGVAELPAGTYMLKIDGADLSIARAFTVGH